MAVSRERYDTQIYTNDENQLVEGLGRDVSIEPQRMCADVPSPVSESPELERERKRTQSYSIGRFSNLSAP